MNQKNGKIAVDNPVAAMIKGNIGIIAVLVIMCVIVSLATDKFLTPNNIISVLRQISINAYIALGMTFIIILGHIDLSVGAIVAMSGTLTVGLVVNQGIPVGPAILLGLLLGTLAGFISGAIVAVFRVPAFIITMAMMNVCSGIAYVYTGGQSTRITDEFFVAIGTGYLFDVIPLPVVYMVILIIIFSFLLAKTKFGRSVYAIGGSSEAARLAGLNPQRIITLCFIMIGVLTALGGIVFAARMNAGQPSANVNLEFDAITAVILGGVSFAGGVGSMGGTVLGILLIQSFNTGLTMVNIPTFWQYVARGGLLLFALAFDFIRKERRNKELLAASMRNAK